MVVIRLSRGGAKKRPFYHLVVADSRSPRDGAHIERVGCFNPISQNSTKPLQLKEERIHYWISQGAQPSPRVSQLIKQYQKEKAGATENPK